MFDKIDFDFPGQEFLFELWIIKKAMLSGFIKMKLINPYVLDLKNVKPIKKEKKLKQTNIYDFVPYKVSDIKMIKEKLEQLEITTPNKSEFKYGK